MVDDKLVTIEAKLAIPLAGVALQRYVAWLITNVNPSYVGQAIQGELVDVPTVPPEGVASQGRILFQSCFKIRLNEHGRPPIQRREIATIAANNIWTLVMRDCYKKFWKEVLVAGFHGTLPQFQLKETASRKAADDAKPSGKPVEFIWNPVDKLVFKLIFTAHTRLDDFWAYCQWSETGKAKVMNQGETDFADNAWNEANGFAHLQTLSIALDKPENVVRGWEFWKPNLELGTTRESHAAYQAEIIAEEVRQISDEDARRRVGTAVDQALADIKRCAMPWFEKKLEWYVTNKM